MPVLWSDIAKHDKRKKTGSAEYTTAQQYFREQPWPGPLCTRGQTSANPVTRCNEQKTAENIYQVSHLTLAGVSIHLIYKT